MKFLILVLAAALGASAARRCTNGAELNAVHLQVEFLADFGAWGAEAEFNAQRRAYRKELVGTIYKLHEFYGPQTEVQLTYYSDLGVIGGVCAKQSAPYFLSAHDAFVQLQEFFDMVGWETYLPSTSAGSLSSALRFNLQSTAWNAEHFDEHGLPIVRVFSIMDDHQFAVRSEGEPIEAGQVAAPEDIGQLDSNSCSGWSHPTANQISADASVFPSGTYFNFVVNQVDHYRDQVLPKIIRNTGSVKEMPIEAAQIPWTQFSMIRDSVCDFLSTSVSKKSEIVPSLKCPAGIVTDPVHLQIEYLLDFAAWGSDESFNPIRRMYREQLVSSIRQLPRLFGPQTEVQLTAYAEAGTSALCAKQASSQFLRAEDAALQLQDIFEQIGWETYLPTEEGALTSALRWNLQSSAWNLEKVDADGRPIVRVFSIMDGHSFAMRTPTTTGVAPPDDLDFRQINDCAVWSAPTKSQLTADSNAFPDSTYFNFVVKDPTYYTNEVLPNILQRQGSARKLADDGDCGTIPWLQLIMAKNAVCDFFSHREPSPGECADCSCAKLLKEILDSL